MRDKLKNKKVLVTAGPTYEPIDPVRFIGNYSSGKMGFALAEELADQGADVTLICGPTSLNINHSAIKRIDVQTADEMFDATVKHFTKCDAAIMAAAVADFKPAQKFDKKVKRNNDNLSIDLEPNKDIAAHLGTIKKKNQVIVGFALETNNELKNAKKKINNKNLDFIVLNSLKDDQAGFGFDTNKVIIIDHAGAIETFNLKTKKEVAIDIINKLITLFSVE